jgi:hypothetical protein
MVAPTVDQIALIKRFEPILYCAPGERFFPSDVKRYVEQCSLWRAMDPAGQFATASTWGMGPAIAAGKIAVTASEAVGDKVFLGKKDDTGFLLYLTSTSQQESFLSLFDWRPPDAVLTNANDYANIEAIASAYETGSLNGSQFWYHAEFFDTVRLNGLFASVLASGGHDFSDLLKPHGSTPAVLKNPALICYYLFFPAHEEGLDGCSGLDAQHFGDYAGDWGCVAVLIDQATPNDPFQPLFIGLTNRNIGLVKQADGSEVRVGMRVLPWTSALTPDAPDHPSLAVAGGTHALYVRGEVPTPVKPFTPADLARASCGAAEGTPGTLSIAGHDTVGDFAGDLGIVLLKAIACSGLGIPLVLPGIGLIAGFAWGLAELDDRKPPDLVIPITPPTPSPTVDKVAPTDTTGKVIHPADVTPANVTPGNAVAWPPDGRTINQRRYDIYVDRDATVLWTGDPQAPGFEGRWGLRVEHDGMLRRSGMLFPNFWRMFFDALVIMDVPGGTVPQPVTPTQKPIPQDEGTPIGNATEGAVGLAAAYDGNADKDWASSPSGSDPAGVWIGKKFPQSHRISGIQIQLSNDLGVVGDLGNFRNCAVYGRTDADPAGPKDGDLIYQFPDPGVPDTKGHQESHLTGFDPAKVYTRVWVTLDNPDGDGLAVFTQVVWYATDS